MTVAPGAEASGLARALGAARTARLTLRAPGATDLAPVYRIHHDPATNAFNPAGPDPDEAASAVRLREWQQHWQDFGFGYWTVESEGVVVGFGGLRHARWLHRPVLNLYYRFGPEAWGRGYAAEMATHAVRSAEGAGPALPVIARTKAENLPSQKTALAAGLVRRPDLDADDGTGVSVILASGWPE